MVAIGLAMCCLPVEAAASVDDQLLTDVAFDAAFNGCAAVYARGMSLSRFRTDFLPKFLPYVSPALPLVTIETDDRVHLVTASVTLKDKSVSRVRMQYMAGYGCVSLPSSGGLSKLTALNEALPRVADKMASAGRARQPAASRLARVLKADILGGKTIGLVVLEHGKLLGEAYAAGYDQNSMWISASVSKSITATLVARLVQKGLMTVDQPVPLSALHAAGGNISAIRVTDLLRQSSGLKCPDDDAGAEEDPEGVVAHIVAGGSYAYPATAHFYRDSCNHSLLDAAMGEVVAAAKIDKRTAVDQLLLAPLAMAHTAKQFADPRGNLFGGAGYATSPRDLARLGQLYLQRGFWRGQQLLPPWWVDYVTLPTSIPEGGSARPRFRNGANCLDYGASFWRVAVSDRQCDFFPSLPRDTFYMAGWQGQLVMIIPSRDMVVVRMGYDRDRKVDDALMGKILTVAR